MVCARFFCSGRVPRRRLAHAQFMLGACDRQVRGLTSESSCVYIRPRSDQLQVLAYFSRSRFEHRTKYPYWYWFVPSDGVELSGVQYYIVHGWICQSIDNISYCGKFSRHTIFADRVVRSVLRKIFSLTKEILLATPL